MSRWNITWLLAGWEFRRFFKWKSQLFSWGISLSVMLGIAFVAPRLVERTLGETVEVGVIGKTPFPLPGAFGMTWRTGDGDALRAAYDAEELAGLLTFVDDGHGRLEARDEGGWIDSMQRALDGSRRASRLAAHALDPQVLADVTASFELERLVTEADGDLDAGADGDEAPDDGRQKPSKWDKILVLTMLGFMFGGVFMGTALLFTGITSEKQQLVTEQVIAAVPAQTWIDGKILGIGLRAVWSTLEMGLWGLLGMVLWRDFVDPGFEGLDHVSLGLLLPVLGLVAAGYALWFCFFAAIAATIDDPNTSSRGMLMLLPMIAPALAVPAWFHPDGGLALAMSFFPPTATMVMTVRLVISEVPTWQVLLAFLLMVAATWLLRRAAGKVFSMAVLMRGKEPTWREILSAARRS